MTRALVDGPALPLFRPEAVAFQRQEAWGEVVLVQSLPIRFLLVGVLTAALLVLAFLFYVDYARKETVPGYLASSTGVARVFAPRPGTIRAVHVAEGQEVAEGDALLTIAVDQTAAAGGNVDDTLLDTLVRRRMLLAERISTQQQLEAIEHSRLEARIAGIDAEAALLEQQIVAQDEKLRIASGRAVSTGQLRTQGFASELDLKMRRESQLDQRQRLDALAQALTVLRNDRLAARIAVSQLPANTAEKVQVLRNEMLDVEQRIAEVEGRRAYVVRAPVTGRVSTLQAAPGLTVDPRQPQLSLLPVGMILRAELFVPTRAAGFIRPGQEVRLLFDAFPYQRFGAQRAHVTSVSRSVLLGSDLAAPVTLHEPSYRVVAVLERQEIPLGPWGEATPLQAEMQLRADIILDRRRLIAWLFDPILRLRLS